MNVKQQLDDIPEDWFQKRVVLADDPCGMCAVNLGNLARFAIFQDERLKVFDDRFAKYAKKRPAEKRKRMP